VTKHHIPSLVLVVGLLASHSVGQISSAARNAGFPPLEQWQSAVVSGNTSLLKSMYSSNPPARIMTVAGEGGGDADVTFWLGLKPRRINLNVLQSEALQAGVQQVVFEAEVHTGTASADRVVYVTEGQLWQQQGGRWKLVAGKRSNATRLQQPASTSKVIYAPGLDAHEEITQALARATKEHKNVLLVFGANWCYDCHVLDLAFQRPDLSAILRRNYEVVHVDVGEGDTNQDIMQQYQVPMKKGIPALAVLDGQGKLLYSQRSGEFEKARALAPEDLVAFLNRWKAGK